MHNYGIFKNEQKKINVYEPVSILLYPYFHFKKCQNMITFPTSRDLLCTTVVIIMNLYVYVVNNKIHNNNELIKKY